jgi:ABC-type multidrug transport system fused ATPase/permease subunit
VSLGRSYWLRIWTDISNGSHDAEVNVNSSQHQFYLMASPDKVPSNHGAAYYLAVYFALCVTVSLVQIYGFYHVYVMSFRGAKSLFRRITFAVLRAPLRWIDTVPIGRIMNRFTSDFNISDTDIPVSPISAYLIILLGSGTTGLVEQELRKTMLTWEIHRVR